MPLDIEARVPYTVAMEMTTEYRAVGIAPDGQRVNGDWIGVRAQARGVAERMMRPHMMADGVIGHPYVSAEIEAREATAPRVVEVVEGGR